MNEEDFEEAKIEVGKPIREVINQLLENYDAQLVSFSLLYALITLCRMYGLEEEQFMKSVKIVADIIYSQEHKQDEK